ncbi:MAG: phosphotransferase [Pyrinomonadaceae bacterium]
MKIPPFNDFQLHFRDDIWLDVAKTICRRHNLPFRNLKRSEHGENIVFLVDNTSVIKIYTPFRKGFQREKAALRLIQNKNSLPLPVILFEGEIEGLNYLVTNQHEGILMTREIWLGLSTRDQVEIISQLAEILRELHLREAETINFDWQSFIGHQALTAFERQKAKGANAEWLERLPFYLEENLKLLPKSGANVFLHGDVHFGNLRFMQANGRWKISGLFDFADSLKGFHEYEFVAVGVLMIQGQKEIQREFFLSYGYKENELDEAFRRRLMLLTILYECSDLRKYALRLKPEAINYTLDELEKSVWAF